MFFPTITVWSHLRDLFFFKYESYLFPKSKQAKQSSVVIASAGIGYRRKPFQKASPELDDLKL